MCKTKAFSDILNYVVFPSTLFTFSKIPEKIVEFQREKNCKQILRFDEFFRENVNVKSWSEEIRLVPIPQHLVC